MINAHLITHMIQYYAYTYQLQSSNHEHYYRIKTCLLFVFIMISLFLRYIFSRKTCHQGGGGRGEDKAVATELQEISKDKALFICGINMQICSQNFQGF